MKPVYGVWSITHDGAHHGTEINQVSIGGQLSNVIVLGEGQIAPSIVWVEGQELNGNRLEYALLSQPAAQPCVPTIRARKERPKRSYSSMYDEIYDDGYVYVVIKMHEPSRQKCFLRADVLLNKRAFDPIDHPDRRSGIIAAGEYYDPRPVFEWQETQYLILLPKNHPIKIAMVSSFRCEKSAYWWDGGIIQQRKLDDTDVWDELYIPEEARS